MSTSGAGDTSNRNVYKGPIASPFPSIDLDGSGGGEMRKGRPQGQNLGDDMFPDLKVMDDVEETTATTTTTTVAASEATATKTTTVSTSGGKSVVARAPAGARLPAPVKIPSAAAIGAAAADAYSHSRLSATVVPGVSKRTDYPLIPSKAALLVIDLQEYLSTPPADGSTCDPEEEYLFNVAMPKVVANVQHLVESFRKVRDANDKEEESAELGKKKERYGSEVIFTYLQALTNDCRDVSLDYKLSGPKLAQLPSPDRPAAFLTSLQPSTRNGKGDILIPKTSCSVFLSTNLDSVLKNLHVEQLVICGQLTDQCVESAVRDAADLGYLVTVVGDACAAKSASSQEKGLAGVKGFARILSTENVVQEMKEAPPALPSELSTDTFNAQLAGLPRETRAPPAASATTAPGLLPTRGSEPIVLESLETERADAETTLPLGIASAAGSPLTNRSTMLNDMDGALTAMLHALQVAGVEYVRYATVDPGNVLRCKVVPLERLLALSTATEFFSVVSVAEVCFGGLPPFADYPVPDSGLDARRVLVLRPDFQSLRILPYAPQSAMVMGSAHRQVSGQVSPLCTRGLLQRVLEAARTVYGIGFSVGVELEFTLVAEHEATGTDGSALKVLEDSVFATTGILNQTQAFVRDVTRQLKQQRIAVELFHAESACGQLEIVLEYQTDPVALADAVVLTRETIQVCARSHGMRALFLPKVFPMQAGNGMHLHFSFRDLRQDKQANGLVGPQGGTLSALGGSFVEGILQQLPALLSLSLPSQNSFRRMGPGCWTGHSVRWCVEDKESPLRVCLDLRTGEATHVEYKLSDSTANVYLELAVILAAGLDGMARGVTLRPASAEGEPLPTSLDESLNCLESNEFLCSVLGPELSRAYIALQRSQLKHVEGWTLEQEVAMAYRRW